MISRIDAAAQAQVGQGILVVGESLVDVFATPHSVKEFPGGSPANVAVGAARLGAPVDLHTSLADDDRGQRLASHFALSGVRLTPSSWTSPRTAMASTRLDAGGSADYEFDIPGQIKALPPTSARVLHTGSISCFLEPGASEVVSIVLSTTAREITFDPNIRPSLISDRQGALARFRAIARAATVVKLSEEDAAWLYPTRNYLDALQEIAMLGPRVVVMTRGSLGSVGLMGDHTVHAPARLTNVVDTVGAGDSFMSMLLACLYEQPSSMLGPDELGHLLERASEAAAITVGRRGANPPWSYEL